LLATALLAGCGSAGAPASSSAQQPAAQPGAARSSTGPASLPASPSPAVSGPPRPVACTSVTTQGSVASASAGAAVTLRQISRAVVEIGPGDLQEVRMIRLARLILSKVR
jgi:hypothetical protein